jgi:hypothetical protein
MSVSRRKPLLAAGVAFFALPAGAVAVTPPSRALFGGGAIGPKYTPGSVHDVTWVGARMSKDRKSLTFYADVDLICGGKKAGVILTTTDAKLRSGGRFSGTNTVDPATNSGIAGTVRFAGRFVHRGIAKGTIKTSNTQNGATCESRDISWEIHSPFIAPHHSGAKAGGLYLGTTKQTFSALVRTNRAGTRLAQASFEYLYRCKNFNPTQDQYGNEVTPATAIKKGAFHGFDHFSHAMPGQPGNTGHWASNVDGKVKGDRVTGTWTVSIQVTRDSDGAIVDQCTSGPVGFTAAK